ncbi:MAG: hypothetical protein IT306_09595 [Chloroflexi bacterium]|nr:hypothetical protein [Chloroflexota bacterium]
MSPVLGSGFWVLGIRRSGHLLALAVGILVLAAPSLALAQTPQKERRFVYGFNLFDGTEYAAGFAPHTVDAVYQLAGHVGTLDPKVTEVYFWPITGEIRTDFTSLNELAPGTLEVGQGGRVIQTLELTEYVVQIDPAGGLPGGRVFLGAEAQARWTFFQAERAAYLGRLRAHAEAQVEHTRKLEELRAASAPGATVALEPPPEPAPFTLYSTEIGRGFAVELPPGEYTIRLREPGGTIVEDSEKRLVVFAPRRTGVGFEVIPQERWTYPEQAQEPSEVLYTAPGGVVYLKPYAAQEVSAEAQARLRNPQDLAPAPGRWQWTRLGPLPPATLMVHDGVREQAVPLGAFTVEQAPGGVLGYRVVPFTPPVVAGADPQQPATAGQPAARVPDITGYRVEAPPGPGVLRLRLVDADGRELAGSAREVVVVSPVPWWRLTLPVILPLAVGLSVVLWRRAQVQSARALTDEQRRHLA